MAKKGIKMRKLLLILLMPIMLLAATGDILSVEIVGDTNTKRDGWYAEIKIEGLGAGGTYDFNLGANDNTDNAYITFSVKSQGYDSDKSLITRTRTVYGVKELRKVYPNQTENEETIDGSDIIVRVILTHQIYALDTITCDITGGFYTEGGTPNNTASDISVTNSTEMGYNKIRPVGNWIWPDRSIISNDSLTLRFFVSHGYPIDNIPVACVEFTVTDENSNVLTQIVTNPTIDASLGETIAIPEYVHTFDISSLTDDDTIVCNAKAYPWIGDTILSTDNSDINAVNPSFYDQVYLIDRDNSYGICYVVVDSANGDDGTGAGDSTITGANATPYATIHSALRGARNFNLAAYSRDNPDNSYVLLKKGTYPCAGGTTFTPNTNSTVQSFLTRHPDVDRDSIVLTQDPSSGNKFLRNLYFKVYDLNLNITADAFLFSAVNANHVLWLDDISVNGFAAATNFGLQNGYTKILATNCTFTDVNSVEIYMIRNCSLVNCKDNKYITAQVGNTYTQSASSATAMLRERSGGLGRDNVFCAYNIANKIYRDFIIINTTDMVYGMAFINNVVERIENSSTPAMVLGSAGIATNNVIVMNNSVVGQRSLMAYNEIDTTENHTNWFVYNNIFYYFANKGDVFTEDGTLTGGWRVKFGVGCDGNLIRDQPFNQEFCGTNCIVVADEAGSEGYIADSSLTGSNAGGGDYHLQDTSQAIGLPGSIYVLYDLDSASRSAEDNPSGAYILGGDPDPTPTTDTVVITPNISKYNRLTYSKPIYKNDDYKNFIYNK